MINCVSLQLWVCQKVSIAFVWAVAYEVRFLMTSSFYRASAERAIFFYQNLSVCHMPVLCQNEWSYHRTFWLFSRGIILPPLQNFKENPLSRSLNIREEMCEVVLYSIEIGHVTTKLMGSHKWPIDLCQFQWSSVTFKGGTWGIQNFWQISIITFKRFDLKWLNLAY